LAAQRQNFILDNVSAFHGWVARAIIVSIAWHKRKIFAITQSSQDTCAMEAMRNIVPHMKITLWNYLKIIPISKPLHCFAQALSAIGLIGLQDLSKALDSMDLARRPTS
jgi:hypothetical protein